MLRSTDPRLNGIWLQWSCDEPIYLSSICQAWPIHTNIYSNRKSLIPFKTESFYCPPNFHLGTTGLSSTNPMMTKASIKLSEPMCYRVLSNTVKADWEVSVNIHVIDALFLFYNDLNVHIYCFVL
ncbi:unnamed protein product [Trichobilharzia regenti]|nr:unnamed protein product [Trichobilharzia regenti]